MTPISRRLLARLGAAPPGRPMLRPDVGSWRRRQGTQPDDAPDPDRPRDATSRTRCPAGGPGCPDLEPGADPALARVHGGGRHGHRLHQEGAARTAAHCRPGGQQRRIRLCPVRRSRDLVMALDSRWGAVQSWLPQVALQALNTGPNPFGRTGTSAGILNETVRQREAYGQYLSWSQANSAGVVAQRAASLGRQAQANGETLTGQYWGKNPYSGESEHYSTSPSVIWVHRDGRQIPSSNTTFDPRTPPDSIWRRVQR